MAIGDWLCWWDKYAEKNLPQKSTTANFDDEVEQGIPVFKLLKVLVKSA